LIRLSIITVNYNSGSNFIGTLNSLKDFLGNENVEYVVIDGGSSDKSWDDISDRKDNIDVLLHESDKGIYDAMNKGISLSKGKWIWFVNSGDKVCSECEKVMELLANTAGESNLLFSDLKLSDGRVISQSFSTIYLLKSMLNHQNLIYNRVLLMAGYDISFKYCADFAHLLKNYKYIRAKKITGHLCTYDLDGISGAADSLTRVEIWKERKKALTYSSLPFFFKFIYKITFTILIFIKRVLPSFFSISKG
jgi:glycosyltransferase involved in cell wall biosynthesis